MREPDARDERLGDVLDRAVAGLEPEDRLARVVRAGRRRQVGGATAALATAAVFVGVVAWAMSIVEEPDVTGPYGSPEDVTFEERNVPWSFSYPADWGTRTYERASPDGLTSMRVTTVANWPIPDGGPYRPNSGDASLLITTLGDGGAVVSVERFWTHETSEIGAGEFGPGPFVDDAQNPGWTFRERARCEGTLCWHVLEWLGPNASNEDRAAAEAIADSVGIADVDRWTETDGVRTTLHDEERGFTVTHPNDGWAVAGENLTPWLSSPGEIVALSTAGMPVSHDPDDEPRVFDAPVAPLALRALGTTDAFVTVQEGGDAAGFEERPPSFRDVDEKESAGGTERDFAWRWIPFHDAGRGFYLFVAIGVEAPAEVRDQVWRIADSLRFLPATP